MAGALGRVGRVMCEAIARADGLALVGGFDRFEGGRPLGEVLALGSAAGILDDSIERMLERAKPDVVVDFTLHPVTVAVADACVKHRVSPVIGATGWSPGEIEELRARCGAAALGAVLAPNFAIGAVLMMQFAEKAARFFEKAEIIEMHHDQKRDAPSGTSKLTAQRMAPGLGATPPIHSVRLPGLVAHQEVIFGGAGETLTIRHDSLARESFVSGVLLAVRRVRALTGLVVGLDALLEGTA